MDQGFSDAGLNFSGSDAVEGVKKVARGGDMSRISAPQVGRAVGMTVATVKDVRRKPVHGAQQDQATIQNLQSAKSWAMMPTQVEFFGGFLAAGLLEKIHLKRTSDFIRMVLMSPLEAIRKTSIAETFTNPRKLAANWFSAVSTHAAGVGERGKRWSEAAAKKAAGLEQAAAANVKTATTVVSGSLPGTLQGAVGWGEKFASKRHGKHVDKATQALMREGRGFFARVRDAIMFRSAPPIEVGELAPALHELQAASAMTGVRKAEHLSGLVKKLEGQIEAKAFAGEAEHRAGAMLKHARKAMNSAHTMEMFSSAGQGGIKNMFGVFAKAAGRIPLFNALIGIGVVTGVGATLLTARMESKEAKAAYADLLQDIGGDTHSPFAQAMKAAHRAQKGWGLGKTAIETVGGVADGMLWASPHGAGTALISAQMLPILAGSFVPDNKALSSYVALNKADVGEIQLASDQRQQAVLQLIALVPSVTAKGGIYNRLAQAVATEMVARNMTAKQVVQTLNDNAAFTSIANEVSVKQEATKIAMEAKKAEVLGTASDGASTTKTVDSTKPSTSKSAQESLVTGTTAPTNEAGMSKAELAYHSAEKPQLLAANGGKQHQGTVAHAQLARQA